jgi:hypothetical protein
MRRSETIYARHLLLTTLESCWVGREATLMTQQLCVIGKADFYTEDLLLPGYLVSAVSVRGVSERDRLQSRPEVVWRR